MNLIKILKKHMGLCCTLALFFCIYFMSLEVMYANAFKHKEDTYFIKIISLKEAGDYTDKYIGKVMAR